MKHLFRARMEVMSLLLPLLLDPDPPEKKGGHLEPPSCLFTERNGDSADELHSFRT